MPEMKDSRIEWIGEIPSNWKSLKLQYACETITDFTASGSFADLAANVEYLDEEDYAMLVRTADLSANRELGRVYVNQHAYEYLHNSNLHGGEIILPNIGSVGTVYYYQPLYVRATLAPNSIMLKAEKNGRYLFYLFSTKQAEAALKCLSNATTQAKFNKTQLRKMKIILPPESTQNKITNFLDSKCAEIDALASDIRAEIDTLEEYKRSVVFDKVLHGLSNNTIMVETDSDVWDKMPQGWKLVDIKYLFEIVKRIAGKEGFDVLSVTQKGLRVKDITSGDGQLADNYSGYQFVYPTDYVMNHMDLLTGWVDLSSMFGVTSPDYRVFRLRDKRNNSLDYYKYVMQCCYMNRIFYSLGQGVSNLGRWRLQTSSFNNFKVPVPPLEEQVAIADFLNKTISETDAIIAEKQIQMATLDEYKKSLIYEYVTGKKEVPHEFNAKAV